MTFSTFETVNCKVDEKIQKIGKLYALTTDKVIYLSSANFNRWLGKYMLSYMQL